jgi:amidase
MTDSIGIIARSITDIQLISEILGVFRHQVPNVTHKPLDQCRFGFFKTDLFDTLATETVKIVCEQAKTALLEAGAIVEDVDMGPDFDGWEGANGRIDKIMNSGADISTFREMTVNPENVSSVVNNRAGAVIPQKDLVRIHDDLAALKPKFDAIAGRYDAIITPSILREAPKVTENDDGDFAALWSCLQVPVINIPGFAGVDGLPVRLAMVAPRYVLGHGEAGDQVR